MIGSFNVSPRNVRRTVVRAIGSASGDGRHDGEVVAVHELGLQSRPEANILIVPVDVDELAELTLVIVKALLETREFLIQLVQRLRDVTGIDLDNGRAAGQLPQGAGDANLDRHYVVVIISSARSVPSPACGGRSPIRTLPRLRGRAGWGPVLRASIRRRVPPGQSCPAGRRSSRWRRPQ